MSLIFLCTILCIAQSACKRDHINIFDPQSNIDSLDLSLRLTRADSVVRLSWQAPLREQILGYNIYRKLETENDFIKLAYITAGQTFYMDSTTHFFKAAEYYLTVRGDGVDSPPTPHLRVTPGPDVVWVLDYWDFYVPKLSFDLKHKLREHYAIWRPRSLSFSSGDQVALITYPEYQFMELFDPSNNIYIQGFDQLQRPWDSLFDSQKNMFWISDSTGAIYTLSPGDARLTLQSSSISRPTNLQLDSKGRLYVQDLKTEDLWRIGGTEAARLTALPDSIINFYIDSFAGKLYTVHKISDARQLTVSLPDGQQSSQLFSDTGLTVVKSSPRDGSIWVALNYAENAELVQLSAAGTRLNTLQPFKSIADFAISERTGNLLVADGQDGTVYHLRPDGTIIGTSKEARYPFRVYIR